MVSSMKASPGMVGSGSRRAIRLVAAAAVGLALTACADQNGSGSYRAYQAIPAETVALMQANGSDSHQPILIRTFKKEAELEIWKMRADGRYVHIKTFPMCRWSGQLGPKQREGDRQVPEGFYTITQGQMNPNSAYYLSFNVGYPNAYDKAHGFSGGSIMVHGDCSSAGCFSMTDAQIAEIYAIAREAFGGGQRAIQMQSLPFRMSAENLAKHRFDPNMKFWRELKEGADQFEVSGRETRVGVCDKRYVFGATPTDPAAKFDANFKCPEMSDNADLKAAVAAKQKQDNHKVAELVASGVKAVKLVYADGGQHPSFASSGARTSRPDALVRAPVEVAINEAGKPIPAVVQIAANKAAGSKTVAAVAAANSPPGVAAVAASASTTPVETSGRQSVAAAAVNPPAAAPAQVASPKAASTPAALTAIAASDTAAGAPAKKPVAAAAALAPPPVRELETQAPTAVVKPQASLLPSWLPRFGFGAKSPVPAEVSAYAPDPNH